MFGGIHATLYPEEAFELGAAHSAVKGDGDVAWSQVLRDCVNGSPERIYKGGRVEPEQFVPARWDLLPGRTDTCGRQCKRSADVQNIVRSVPSGAPMDSGRDSGLLTASLQEIVELRRKGFRFMALADDNFYPVSLTDMRSGGTSGQYAKSVDATASDPRERFELMGVWPMLPKDMVFFTQITMEAAEDTEVSGRDAKARSRARW